jgi:hypothetical protein
MPSPCGELLFIAKVMEGQVVGCLCGVGVMLESADLKFLHFDCSGSEQKPKDARHNLFV